MKRKVIAIAAIVLAGIFATPIFLNLRRVSVYEERVSNILSGKAENWYLPKQIPEAATNKYYNYTEGWGQGGSSNTLKFRLPEEAAQDLRDRIVSGTSSKESSDLSRPKIITSDRYEELVWTAFDGNHGSEGGVWYNAKKDEFVFYHRAW